MHIRKLWHVGITAATLALAGCATEPRQPMDPQTRAALINYMANQRPVQVQYLPQPPIQQRTMTNCYRVGDNISCISQ